MNGDIVPFETSRHHDEESEVRTEGFLNDDILDTSILKSPALLDKVDSLASLKPSWS